MYVYSIYDVELGQNIIGMDIADEEHSDISAWDVPPDRALKWLSEVLRLRVESVSSRPLVTHVTLGKLQKLIVIFEVNGKKSKTSLVLKTESLSPGANTFAAKARCFVTEHTFYTVLAQRCVASVPRCFYSSISPQETSATLLLQHVMHAHPGGADGGLSVEQARAAVEELGRFHASYFDDDVGMALVKTVAEHVSGFDGTAALASFLDTWEDVLAPFADENGNNFVRAVFEHCAEHLQNWTDLLQVGIPSIVHGDYKGTNILFGGSKERATVLDFQTLYSGRRA